MKALHPFPHALLIKRLSLFALFITVLIGAFFLVAGWILKLDLEQLPWGDSFYVPVLLWVFLTWVFYDSALLAWKRGQNRVSRNRALLVGKVKGFDAQGREFFAWWYGLRRVPVDLGNEQLTFGYLSSLTPDLEPASPVRLHLWGSYMGKERYVAEPIAMRHSFSRDGHS